MSNPKKSKSKFISEELNDIINNSQFVSDSSKNNKHTKPKTDKDETSNFSIIKTGIKKKKNNEDFEDFSESRQKLLNVMNRQLELRKENNQTFLENFHEVITHCETNYTVLKENEQKLVYLTSNILKCLQQTIIEHNEKIKALKEIYETFRVQCEKLDLAQKTEIDKLGNELEEDIDKLKQKLISETKRIEWENIQKLFVQANPNKF